MWSGFSSEIEIQRQTTSRCNGVSVACGAASHLRLKSIDQAAKGLQVWCRMWSGFSSEIEIENDKSGYRQAVSVACGAASHLRLKLRSDCRDHGRGGVACGAASHLRLK